MDRSLFPMYRKPLTEAEKKLADKKKEFYLNDEERIEKDLKQKNLYRINKLAEERLVKLKEMEQRLKGNKQELIISVERITGLIKTENLKKYNRHLPGVYFLFNGNKVVYVGQSKNNIFVRGTEHSRQKNWKWDSCSFIPLSVTPEDLDLVEAAFIEKHNPKYNKNKPFLIGKMDRIIKNLEFRLLELKK